MGFTKVIKSLIFILSVIVIIQPQVILTLPFIKILPEFSYETISNSTSINLSEDAPLNSGLISTKQIMLKKIIFTFRYKLRIF